MYYLIFYQMLLRMLENVAFIPQIKWDCRSKEGIYVGYHTEHQTHLVRFPDGTHCDTTDMEFNEIFDDTYRPRGLMTNKGSHENRNKDGSPSLLHAASGNPCLVPENSSCDDDLIVNEPTEEHEFVEVKRKRKRPLTPTKPSLATPPFRKRASAAVTTPPFQLSPVPVESDSEPNSESSLSSEGELPEAPAASQKGTNARNAEQAD
jgi:hypothetical protein